MTKRNRLIASVVAFAVVFAMLFAVCFIIAEADHDCVGDDCTICCQIAFCENSLRSVGRAAIAVIVAALGFLAFLLPSFAKRSAYGTSLVTLKVKLSD